MKHKRVKNYRMDIKCKGQCVKLIEMIPFLKYILDIGWTKTPTRGSFKVKHHKNITVFCYPTVAKGPIVHSFFFTQEALS